jgi:hypothetical protein
MALTFPRDLIEFGGKAPFRAVSFEPQFLQVVAPTRGGLAQVANVGPELWRIKYETRAMNKADAAEFSAWAQSLRGGAKLFKAYHPQRALPQAYPGGFGSLTKAAGGSFAAGTGSLTAIGTTRDTITVNGLPASFALNVGDMLSYPIGDTRALHRVMEDATGNGSGVVTLTVEPTVPLAATTSVSVLFLKPYCHAVIDARSFEMRSDISGGSVGRFDAYQVYA